MRKIDNSDSRLAQSTRTKAPSPLRSAGALQNSLSRRNFLSTALAAPVLIGVLRNAKAAGEVISFKSPNSELQFVLLTTAPHLRSHITPPNPSISHLSESPFL